MTPSGIRAFCLTQKVSRSVSTKTQNLRNSVMHRCMYCSKQEDFFYYFLYRRMEVMHWNDNGHKEFQTVPNFPFVWKPSYQISFECFWFSNAKKRKSKHHVISNGIWGQSFPICLRFYPQDDNRGKCFYLRFVYLCKNIMGELYHFPFPGYLYTLYGKMYHLPHFHWKLRSWSGVTSDNSNWATAPAATAAGESSGCMFTIIEIQAFLSRNLGAIKIINT